ncbi:stalk domain-containing protein [Paenibacillus luteus]|uniref:stalk domain-containing protein n=1 Tax=Paenibacillus luteus TaxID=2545753 RepID=UPI003BA997D2
MLTVNSKKVIVDHTEIELDVPVELINSITYVPLRFISHKRYSTPFQVFLYQSFY